MKQLVLETNSEVKIFDPKNGGDPRKYYGGIVKQCAGENKKAFIVRTSFEAGDYRLYSKNVFTDGNFFGFYTSYNLNTLIFKILKNGDNVFEFETPEELFKWLAEP